MCLPHRPLGCPDQRQDHHSSYVLSACCLFLEVGVSFKSRVRLNSNVIHNGACMLCKLCQVLTGDDNIIVTHSHLQVLNFEVELEDRDLTTVNTV